ncbi:hypothetical protein CEP54_008227 [Fusarium duplospermum]|uniref:Major facilitator superfamily (MFS) profile domain-containing protein n=1 Tax=Fusarium duplospermum TaxID=1325734 RepID=A0A428PX57_9HYPO|nr:hypothetical protein CEP54_008227 [Fusarium duplospermum]
MGAERDYESVSDSQSNAVDWDGPDDPEHPFNWPKKQKVIHIGLVTFINFVLNLAATLFAPAAQNLATDFSVTNSTVLSLTVSIYLLGFAVGPLIVAPLSEVYGRLWVYHICNVCFLAFLVGCAASQNIAIGGGTVADLLPPARRGSGMAIFGTGILLGPIVGPIIGGFVAGDLGWRWTLWIVVIISGQRHADCRKRAGK